LNEEKRAGNPGDGAVSCLCLGHRRPNTDQGQERGYDQHSEAMITLKESPTFREIRSDPVLPIFCAAWEYLDRDLKDIPEKTGKNTLPR
jgi:hypothetical protein